MNLKKILALLLAAVMVCGMLAGCGGSNQGEKGDSGTQTSAALAETGTQAASEAAADKASTEAAKDAGGDVTVIRFYGSDGEYNQNIVAGVLFFI